jgi:phage baseplate assembly protein W
MRQSLFRSWKFGFPWSGDYHHAAESGSAGLCVSGKGAIQMVEGEDAIRQSIMMLLSTIPGERIMFPTYGCDLHKLVFSPNDDTTAGLAMHYVREALERWEPRLEILKLDAHCNGSISDQNLALEIVLMYRIRSLQQESSLKYSISLNGGIPHVAPQS